MTDWHKFLIQHQDDIADDCAKKGEDFSEEVESLAEFYRLLADERLIPVLGQAFQEFSAARATETEYVAGYARLMAEHGHPKAPFTGLKQSKATGDSIPRKKALAFKAQHEAEAQQMADDIHARNPKLSFTAIRNRIIKEFRTRDISTSHSTLKKTVENPRHRK